MSAGAFVAGVAIGHAWIAHGWPAGFVTIGGSLGAFVAGYALNDERRRADRLDRRSLRQHATVRVTLRPSDRARSATRWY